MLGNPSCQKQPNLITSAARKQAEELLSGGVWVPRSWFVSKLRRYGHAITMLGDALGLAESDYGGFVCLPDDSTPLEAPDEALVAAGLSKHHAVIEAVREWKAEQVLRSEVSRKPCRTPKQAWPEPDRGQFLLAI